jgi:hypothetical protein
VAHQSKRLDYAVYPSDFHIRGVCWTFRVITKARTKAKSLGAGSWIRRYVNATDKDTSKCSFQIDRLWQWNGARFVRLRKEPPFYRLHLPSPHNLETPPVNPRLNLSRHRKRLCLLRCKSPIKFIGIHFQRVGFVGAAAQKALHVFGSEFRQS